MNWKLWSFFYDWDYFIQEDFVKCLKELKKGFTFTIICATIFLLFQGYEYYWANFYISDGIQGTIFYALTGLHGFHVIIGTFLIVFTFIRLFLVITKMELIIAENKNKCKTIYNMELLQYIGHFPQIGLLATYWYWQFVDVVWCFLFIFLYLPLA